MGEVIVGGKLRLVDLLRTSTRVLGILGYLYHLSVFLGGDGGFLVRDELHREVDPPMVPLIGDEDERPAVLAGAKELDNVLLLLSDHCRGIVLATRHLFVLAACP